jgi:hypothetical protein
MDPNFRINQMLHNSQEGGYTAPEPEAIPEKPAYDPTRTAPLQDYDTNPDTVPLRLAADESRPTSRVSPLHAITVQISARSFDKYLYEEGEKMTLFMARDDNNNVSTSPSLPACPAT